jgi:hypothetical protein
MTHGSATVARAADRTVRSAGATTISGPSCAPSPNLGAPVVYVGLAIMAAALLALGVWVQRRFVPRPTYGVPAGSEAPVTV